MIDANGHCSMDADVEFLIPNRNPLEVIEYEGTGQGALYLARALVKEGFSFSEEDALGWIRWAASEETENAIRSGFCESWLSDGSGRGAPDMERADLIEIAWERKEDWIVEICRVLGHPEALQSRPRKKLGING